MRWSWLDDEALFWQVWAEVWREMRLALPWPRKIRPAPRHGTGILVRRWVKPVIRSWIGRVGTPIPSPS